MRKTAKKIVTKMSTVAFLAMFIGAGFAFSMINDDPNVYLHPENGVWLPLDGMQPIIDYDCEPSSSDCTGYSTTPNDSLTTPEQINKGTFKLAR